jgi:hypothetical protein
MVEPVGYARTVDDVGLSADNIELTFDGANYVVQWANNLSEYTPTGALLATAPLTGESFSIAGLKGSESGNFVLLEGSFTNLGEVTLDSVSELNSGTPAFLDTEASVVGSNVIGLSNGSSATAWFDGSLSLSLFAPGFNTVFPGMSAGGTGFKYPALAQLSDGSIVVGWTSNQPLGVIGLEDINVAIVSATGTTTGGNQISDTTSLGYRPAIAALSNGDFAAYWIDFPSTAVEDGVPSAVEEQIFSSTGAEVGGPTVVSTLSDTHGGDPSATTLSNGDVVLVYLQGGPQVVVGGETLDENIIQGQVFSPDGAPIAGDAFSINSNGATQVSVTGLADGDFAVGWITQNETAGTVEVKSQIFTLGGTVVSQSVDFH